MKIYHLIKIKYDVRAFCEVQGLSRVIIYKKDKKGGLYHQTLYIEPT